jgi:hypothetical protein
MREYVGKIGKIVGGTALTLFGSAGAYELSKAVMEIGQMPPTTKSAFAGAMNFAGLMACWASLGLGLYLVYKGLKE